MSVARVPGIFFNASPYYEKREQCRYGYPYLLNINADGILCRAFLESCEMIFQVL